MGVIKFFSSDSTPLYSGNDVKVKKFIEEYENLPNPKPNNYTILKHKEINGNLVIRIVYPDCTNYEGEKILVYKDTTIEQLEKQELIDPHFSEDENNLYPFARFEPTIEGQQAACKLAEII